MPRARTASGDRAERDALNAVEWALGLPSLGRGMRFPIEALQCAPVELELAGSSTRLVTVGV
jgi:hypothetical protein